LESMALRWTNVFITLILMQVLYQQRS